VTVGPSPGLLAGRTAWVRNLAQPVRLFVATEAGSAVILLAATLTALLWANSPWGDTYEQVWTTELSIDLGDMGISHDLRHWINDGLMAFFFFVVGLEIRRELDMGDLRERRRVAVPVLAALGGMAVPALIYASFNAGTEAVHGWGIVMATDTAFALALLGLVGRGWSLRVRVFMLTLVVVDDVAALTVIGLAYTGEVAVLPLLLAAGLFALVVGMRSAGVRHGAPYLLLGVALWLALMEGGVHPTIAGVAMGLLATAYPPTRDDLQRAASLWRLFREQPTSELARSASRGVKLAISPNERMQQLFHLPTSFFIVPLFTLANAGVAIDGELLRRAATSPITIGIGVALVLGKLIGITGASWLATRRWLGGFPLTIAWPPLIGAATIAGIGFTVALFIAELSFEGDPLAEAKIGILTASVVAAGLGWLVFKAFDRLPQRLRAGGRTPPAAPLIDLTDPVDEERDHIRGPADAQVTLLEYGDFQCPYCGRAEPVIRELLAEFGRDLRYVFRHLPLEDVHEHAQQAAEAAEAAGAQGKFWEMHDLLFRRQDALSETDLIGYAVELDLDVGVFEAKLRKRKYAPRVAADVESADLSGVTGTPTVFINGRRYHGAFNLPALQAKVRSALASKAH
jgi:Na+/H+ antiporter NhaA